MDVVLRDVATIGESSRRNAFVVHGPRVAALATLPFELTAGRTLQLWPVELNADFVTSQHSIDDILRALYLAALEPGRDRGATMAAVVLPETATREQRCVQAIGFKWMTSVLLLSVRLDALPDSLPTPFANAARWESIFPERTESLVDLVAATYVDSQDCPELAAYGPVADDIDDYRGRSEHGCDWSILRIGETPAGVLFLSPDDAGDEMRLDYFGMLPKFRSRGYGGLFMQAAIAKARLAGCRELTALVYRQNERCRLRCR